MEESDSFPTKYFIGPFGPAADHTKCRREFFSRFNVLGTVYAQKSRIEYTSTSTEIIPRTGTGEISSVSHAIIQNVSYL